MTRLRAAAGIVIAILLVAPLASAQTRPAQTPPSSVQTSGRMLVVPFENISHDRSIVWLGEASSVLLTDELNARGANAITRDERRLAFEQLQVPLLAALTDATIIRIGQIVGASTVVVGTLALDGGVLKVRARAIALESARVQADITVQGNVPGLFDIFEQIAEGVHPLGRNAPPETAKHPPVAAFENYIKGLVAETPGTAITYLNAAIRADATFDRARLALWDIYDEQAEHARALAAVMPVAASSTFARRARFLAGLSQIHLERYDDAFATFKTLAEASATPAALNNLGVIQLRRPATPQTGVATYYFGKAAEADAGDADYCFNLGYAYWQQYDAQSSLYWLREAVRRDATDGEAHFVLGAALTALGSSAEAARERELARRLSSTYADWEKRPPSDPVPKGLERLHRGIELPRAARIDEVLASSGQRDQRELATFYLDRGRRLFEQERDREALAELSRVVFLTPYEAEAHLLIGRIHLRAGRAKEAIDALKISIWSRPSGAAHAALAQAYLDAGDSTAAKREATTALALEPGNPAAVRILALPTVK